MKERPTGRPEAVPTGIVICAKARDAGQAHDAQAERFEILHRRGEQRRNTWCGRKTEDRSGMGQAADPFARVRLSASCTFDITIRYACRGLHSFANAWPEFRLVPLDEAPVIDPNFARLDDTKALPPRIESGRCAARSTAGLGSSSAIASSADRSSAATSPSASAKASSKITRFRIVSRKRGPSSRTAPTARKTPGPLANHPATSKDGAIAMAPEKSIRPCVGRIP
jgi:hypothetical protein